jgi:hypothetical protein
VTQLQLLADVEIVERPYKDVRRVSKQLIRELRESGYVKRSGKRVLFALEFYRQRYQEWPTPAELTKFMADQKWIPKDESRYVAPRLTELIRGAWVRSKDGTRRHIGGGVCEQLTARECRETGQTAHPVALREIGSTERRVA